MSPEIDPDVMRQRRIEEVLSAGDIRRATVNTFFLKDEEVTSSSESRSVETVDMHGNTLCLTQYFMDGGDILDVEYKEVVHGLETATVQLYFNDEQSGVWTALSTSVVVATS